MKNSANTQNSADTQSSANGMEQHAVLAALLAKHAFLLRGSDGEAAYLAGVKRLGIERGTRMAYRALAKGEKLDIIAFFAFGEWTPDEGITMETKFTRKEPSVVTCAEGCAWNDFWRKHALLEYGRLYCKVIDDALANGFYPEFHCHTLSNLSFDDNRCEFDWGVPVSEGDLSRLARLKAELGKSCVKSFDYHTGHLIYSVGGEMADRLGSDGIQAVLNAEAEFASIFGNRALEIAKGSYP
jgi:hypothetical protein